MENNTQSSRSTFCFGEEGWGGLGGRDVESQTHKLTRMTTGKAAEPIVEQISPRADVPIGEPIRRGSSVSDVIQRLASVEQVWTWSADDDLDDVGARRSESEGKEETQPSGMKVPKRTLPEEGCDEDDDGGSDGADHGKPGERQRQGQRGFARKTLDEVHVL